MTRYEGLDGILLIDDDHSTNFIHKSVIHTAGIDAEVAAITNVAEALDFLTYTGKYRNDALSRPNIIFLDINMPGLNGWDFLDAYRLLDDRYKAKVVIIMLAVSINPDDKEKAFRGTNVDDFVIKPLGRENLLEIINQHFVPVDQDVNF